MTSKKGLNESLAFTSVMDHLYRENIRLGRDTLTGRKSSNWSAKFGAQCDDLLPNVIVLLTVTMKFVIVQFII